MSKHNYPAIILLVIAHGFIGFIWYGPIFGEIWAMAAYGKTVEQMKMDSAGMSPAPYIVNLIGNICMCFFLSWLVVRLNYSSFADGLKLGALIAAGIVFPVISTHYMFLSLKNTVLFIDLGMSVFLVMLSAAVLGGWRKK